MCSVQCHSTLKKTLSSARYISHNYVTWSHTSCPSPKSERFMAESEFVTGKSQDRERRGSLMQTGYDQASSLKAMIFFVTTGQRKYKPI